MFCGTDLSCSHCPNLPRVIHSAGLLGVTRADSIMGSAAQMAKRSLVKVLLSLATVFDVVLGINRDSPDADLREAYGQMRRRAARTRKEEAEQHKQAKIAWEQALASRAQVGRPASAAKSYRFQASAVLLTYQGIRSLDHWQQFVAFLQMHLQAWGVKHWTATLGMCKSGRLHVHLMLQFHCCDYYHKFSANAGRRKSKYHKCGRKAWKLTEDLKKFLVRTLLKQRKEAVCTTTTLQYAAAVEKGVTLQQCTIRKYIMSQGYKWLRRGQKRKYSPEIMEERLKFAKKVKALGVEGLREKLSFSTDGAIIAMPPSNPTERVNFLRAGFSHMWRLSSERCIPELAGEDMYAKQVKIQRAIPLWGGLSAGGGLPQWSSTRTRS